MPVFVKSGGMVPTRSKDVTNDVQNPLDAVTLTVAAGATGHASLFEDDGTTSDRKQSTSTDIRYTEGGQLAALRVDGPRRAWVWTWPTGTGRARLPRVSF
ncbi:DUF5110 domain-containing protein [Archangium lipolyticum]|uniref:DUF5110 domain-containing protein n=1 Tax=Archangium lipolyticum TaxID=2970465 RepID=UPI002149E168|nr:DUF5110 domain-containing protein [Archangium lipolyticum]